MNLVYIMIYIPKDPDMSYERDFPYIPLLGMGFRPSINPTLGKGLDPWDIFTYMYMGVSEKSGYPKMDGL